MDNEIAVPEHMVKKEWYSTKEFIAGVNTSSSGFHRWLKDHPDFVQKYCQNISHGTKRTRYRILWKGIAAYVNEYAKTRPAKKIVNNMLSISKAKEVTTELANREIERQLSQPTMTPEAMLLETARLLSHLTSRLDNAAVQFRADHARIDKVEATVESIENKLNEPLPASSLHRQFLGDRVKLFAIKQDIHYSFVWRKVNKYVGRGHISYYDFADFQKALRFIKSMYEEAKMEWS